MVNDGHEPPFCGCLPEPLRVDSSERSLEATFSGAPICTPRYSRVVPVMTSWRVASSLSWALGLLGIVLERFSREMEGRCRGGYLIFLRVLSNPKSVVELGYAIWDCINLLAFRGCPSGFTAPQELP